MSAHLSVGVESNCVAPLQLERSMLRLCHLFGVDSLFVPDHYLSFVPRSVWGNVEDVLAEIRPLVDAGLRHVVIWNVGPLATGANLGGLLRLAVLIRRLRKLPLSHR